MATVLRDMQVRATITDEDMRLVLHVTVTLNVTVWKKTDDSRHPGLEDQTNPCFEN
jgi:hypothetical protein